MEHQRALHFRLFYQGPLKAKGSLADKHYIRQSFHAQLKRLWSQPPLRDIAPRLNMDPTKGKALGVQRGPHLCVPLVCESLELVTSLEIILLRPEAPGSVLTQADEEPFYCLVEDDNLITGLNVTTDRLLIEAKNSNEVVLLIQVHLEFTHQHFTNLVPPPRLV